MMTDSYPSADDHARDAAFQREIGRLRQENERLREMIENSPDAAYRRDLRSDRYIYVSQNIQKILEFSPSELSEMSFEEIQRRIHPDDVQSVRERIAEASVYGHGKLEYRFLTKTSGYRWLSDHLTVQKDKNDRPLFRTGSVRDISEQKRSEEALRESAERYRLVNLATHDVIWDWDLRTDMIEWNESVKTVFGFDPGEFGPSVEGWNGNIHPDDQERVLAGIYEAIRRGEETWTDEYRFRHKNGSWRTVYDRGIIARDREGNAIRMIGSMTDLSERSRMEENLRKAKEEAEAANQAKSEFLAHMSHEIRTPISGIIGMVDVLMADIKEPEQREHLSLVKESAESLLSIIGDILDLSRIESGIVELEETEVESRKEIAAVVNPFRVEARRKHLAFSLEVGSGLPEYVRADREKIAQILRNLLSNALKYTEKGEIAVSVTNTGERNGKIGVRFRIRDTGVGIPSEKREAIFESFVRLRRSVTERNVEGTGLGLTITRRLVELLGGSISVESRVGEGSTFTFAVDVEPIEKVEHEGSPAPVEGLAELPSLSILVAEDNRINQMFLDLTLRNAGHRVALAGNGREVLELILNRQEEHFDLVLMDIQMPIMDGIEATKAIRSLESPRREVPIIALTAFALKGDEERFRKAGVDAYVTKPVDWSELTRTIQRLSRPADF